jgi:predicted deacylase
LKSRIINSYQTPSGQRVEVVKQSFSSFDKPPIKRVAFVSGLHGNELEGIYLCHLLTNYLKELQDTQPERLLGEVHIYPSVNPQASAIGVRLWPFLSIDLNRQFKNTSGNSLAISSAEALINDLKASADIVIDCHASNLYLKEVPQIRIIEGFHKKLIPLAVQCNVDLIWVHPPSPVFESTLGYNLNKSKIPTLVIETGIALRINQDFVNQLFKGMLKLLYHLGVISTEKIQPKVNYPIVIQPSQVVILQSDFPGLFIANTDIKTNVSKGDIIGKVVDAMNGKILKEIIASDNGFLFTLREHPLVYPGDLLARIALKEMD